jgi:2-keto-4-pentenoate hydratase
MFPVSSPKKEEAHRRRLVALSAALSGPAAAVHDGGAAAAAQTLLLRWLDRRWIGALQDCPSVGSIDEVYAIHAAMADDPLVTELGGVAGYKMGGVGQVAGVAAAYGPLFGCGVVDAPAGVSQSRFNLFNLEVEFGFVSECRNCGHLA